MGIFFIIMITLKTLDQATEQQVFDQVATHLLTQNKRSANEKGECMYRGPEGLKCAAGCLIADDEYEQVFEGNSWRWFMVGGRVSRNCSGLINNLQSCHDLIDVNQWRESLKSIASRFKLSTEVLNNF